MIKAGQWRGREQAHIKPTADTARLPRSGPRQGRRTAALPVRRAGVTLDLAGLVLGGAAVAPGPLAPAAFAAGQSTGWSIVPSPSIGPLDNVLSGVTTTSATSAWAVGYTSVSVPPRIYHRAMIEHWNGRTWRVVPTPQAGTSDSDLWGVTAFSATNAWAVGNVNVGRFRFRPLVEHWNGTAWRLVRVPSPPLTGTGASLFGVAATSPRNIWAVGDYATGKRFQPLIEHYNGTGWTIVPAPMAGSAELNRISLLTPSNGWAVGLRGASSPAHTQALIEHWNGHRWTAARTPAVPGGSLADVLALSPRLAWAVGSAAAPHGDTRTLIERWNGRAWAITPSPKPPTRQRTDRHRRNPAAPVGGRRRPHQHPDPPSLATSARKDSCRGPGAGRSANAGRPRRTLVAGRVAGFTS